MPQSPEAVAARSWSRLADAELLQVRFCDLGLRLQGTLLERRLNKVHTELERRGLSFRPHMWLSEEWFSPDGIPGIAVPFYLAHPRLIRLERRMMRQVEGGNSNWMMRILRHEVGHAIDTAYRLRRRARWRELFGPPSLPYPKSYFARPGSRSFVRHLGDWYAQSHPTEDFAETFAVWLKPRSDWQRTYASWPAWEKLRLVDEMMTEIAGTPPLVRSRAFIEPLSRNTRTLGQHYREKLARQSDWRSEAADGLLMRVFSLEPERAGATRAATFLRARRRELLAIAKRHGDADEYTMHQVLRIAIERSDNMQLYLRGSQRNAMPHARWLLASLARLLGERERPYLNL
jgi:hypothetical protein